MKPGQAPPLLTLDAGSHAFRLAVTTRFGRSGYVKEIASCDPSPEALRALVIARGWKGAPVRVVLQHGELSWRHTGTPRMARRYVTGALDLESRKFTTMDLAQCHWNYRPMTPPRDVERDQLAFQVAVAPADHVEHLTDLARAAGLKPVAVLPLPEAIRETVDAALTQDGAVAVLDCGADHTRVIILHRGEPVLYRSLGIGGRQLTEELRTVMVPGRPALTFTLEEAEALKCAHGLTHEAHSELRQEVMTASGPAVLPLAQVSETLRPSVERLVRELYSTIDYWRERFSEVPFSEVRLLGGGALLPGLPDYLTRVLGVPVALAAPPALVGMEQPLAIPGSVAAGAAVAGFAAIDLLSPRPDTPLELAGRPLTTSRVAAVLLLTLGLGLAGGLWRVRTEERAVKGAEARLNGQGARADLLRVAAGVRGQVEKSILLKQNLTSGAPDWPAILAGLSRQVMPEARLTAMDVEAAAPGTEPSVPHLRLSGIVNGNDASPQVLARLLTCLQDVPGIGASELVSATTNDDGDEVFEIRSTLLSGGLQ